MPPCRPSSRPHAAPGRARAAGAWVQVGRRRRRRGARPRGGHRTRRLGGLPVRRPPRERPVGPHCGRRPDTETGCLPAQRPRRPRHPHTDYPAALAAFYTQQVDWQSCADGPTPVRRMEVPVDYAKPAESASPSRCARCRRPTRQAARLARRQPRRAGASGVQYAQLSSFAFTPELRRHTTSLASTPVGSGSPRRALPARRRHGPPSASTRPRLAAERSKLLAEADGITANCAKRGGERCGTSAPPRSRATWTSCGCCWATGSSTSSVAPTAPSSEPSTPTLPKHVGRMVLDSAMSPNKTEQQEMTYDIQGFDRSTPHRLVRGAP